MGLIAISANVTFADRTVPDEFAVTLTANYGPPGGK